MSVLSTNEKKSEKNKGTVFISTFEIEIFSDFLNVGAKSWDVSQILFKSSDSEMGRNPDFFSV